MTDENIKLNLDKYFSDKININFLYKVYDLIKKMSFNLTGLVKDEKELDNFNNFEESIYYKIGEEVIKYMQPVLNKYDENKINELENDPAYITHVSVAVISNIKDQLYYEM